MTGESGVTHIYIVYKSVDGADLRLYIFNPPKHTASSKSAAIVFFSGGGWVFSDVGQFFPQSEYLARRGIVAIVADYRVLKPHKSNPFDSVVDARSAIRYVRAHAAELGIDPTRVVASGDSAGGHIALCTAVFECLDEVESAAISSKPNALILFNPCIDLMSGTVNKIIEDNFAGDIANRIEQISPFQHNQVIPPPTVIFNGTADTITPYATAEKFCDNARALGGDCRFIGYDGAEHAFCNRAKWRRKLLLDMDQFLTEMGYLSGPTPTELFE